MSASVSGRPARRQATMLVGAVLLYGLAALAGAFQHHDLACHVKSNTHCTSCTLSLAASDAVTGGVARTPSLGNAGRLARSHFRARSQRVSSRVSDRSPPGRV
jgi:hypothetical protein